MKTIDAGTIDAIELVFAASLDANDDRRYILQAEATDYMETLNRFPAHQIKRTTEHYIDDTEGKWFAFYNVDCFDPPMAVIRAKSFETAYDVFCDEWERWLKVDDIDAADYPEDNRSYNGNGTHIDIEAVQGNELFLLSVRVA